MDQLFSEFDSISKSSWLDKVEKDLKGKAMSDLNWQWEGMEFTPFHHRDDRTITNQSLKENNQWLINQEIQVSNEKSANELAIAALEGGCTSLTFLADDFNKIELTQLLEGIQLEWIFTQFISKETLDHSYGSEVLKYASSKGYDPKLIRLAYSSQIDSDAYTVLNSNEQSGLAGDISILNKVDFSSAEKHIIKMNTTDHYYGNICRIRAMRRLFNEKGLTDHVLIQADISPTNDMNDVNYRFIQSNAQALAAVIGGADIVNIISEESVPFQDRINRNVNHLLQLESYLHRVGDPSAGSYFLEHMTEMIYQKMIGALSKKEA